MPDEICIFRRILMNEIKIRTYQSDPLAYYVLKELQIYIHYTTPKILILYVTLLEPEIKDSHKNIWRKFKLNDYWFI